MDLETELAQARAELDNIKVAIRRGIVTATTRAMLEEAESKVAFFGGPFGQPA